MRVRTYGSILEDIQALMAEAKKYAPEAKSAIDTIKNPQTGIEWIKIQTAYGPDILIKEPLVPGAGEPDPIVKLLKPKVTIKLRPVAEPLYIAPEGEPGETKWPTVSAAAVFGGALLGIFVLRGILR